MRRRYTRGRQRHGARGTPGWKRSWWTPLVRGETEDSLHSWASALNWSSSPVAVVVGTIGDEDGQGGG